MIRLARAFVCGAMLAIPLASAQRLPWSSIDPTAATALHAFRQTDHWVADAMAENLDGNRLGRDSEEGFRPMNFDTASHLRYRVVGMRQGAPPAVLLLFASHSISDNGPSPGVIMQEVETAAGRSWHIACKFRDYGLSLTLLDRRSHGWRHFRVASGEYGWRPATFTPGVPLPEGAQNGPWNACPWS